MKLTEQTITHIIIGSGAAGFQAALRLYQNGERDLAIITENIKSGTSRNTGSDKQTYYKLTLSGNDADSVRNMAGDCTGGLLQVSKAVGDGAAAGMAIIKYVKMEK